MRKRLARALLAAGWAFAIAETGNLARGPLADDSLMRDLAAGAIVVAIVAAVAWAEHELEGARPSAE